ncbi:MAG: response regulator transcription factor [Verrucomicrobia bacterium]|nr:response regulator transcription factor [Verrucomicrobiota bacterium]MDA1085863.1 response regulator transcription factor [Verrucomicrobiota bacterium]
MNATAKSSSTVNVFLVDDHAIVRDGLRLLVESQDDMKVCGEAECPEEALRRIGRADANLLVADLKYNNGSGMEFIRELKARYPEVRVLVLSMHEESAYAERTLRAGASGYVMKSGLRGTLLEAIREIMDGRIYLSERMKDMIVRRSASGVVDPPGSGVDDLSNRELEVFDLLGSGASSREVADQLEVSVRTVHTHRERIKQKLGLANSAELMQRAVAWVLKSDVQ